MKQKMDNVMLFRSIGFLVNLVGIFIFQHGGAGHGHSHGGDESHGHSHGKDDHGHSHNGGHSHDKGHHHGHSHGGSDSQIMKGVSFAYCSKSNGFYLWL